MTYSNERLRNRSKVPHTRANLFRGFYFASVKLRQTEISKTLTQGAGTARTVVWLLTKSSKKRVRALRAHVQEFKTYKYCIR